jgi:hypothetical protein
MSYNVIALASSLAPLVSTFLVMKDGQVDKAASHEAFMAYVESKENEVAERLLFESDLLDAVNGVLEKKADNVRVSIADLSEHLAHHKFLANASDDEKLTHSGSVAEYISNFIKDRATGPEKHVPKAARVLYSWQEKGKGAGVCLLEKYKPKKGAL